MSGRRRLRRSGDGGCGAGSGGGVDDPAARSPGRIRPARRAGGRGGPPSAPRRPGGRSARGRCRRSAARARASRWRPACRRRPWPRRPPCRPRARSWPRSATRAAARCPVPGSTCSTGSTRRAWRRVGGGVRHRPRGARAQRARPRPLDQRQRVGGAPRRTVLELRDLGGVGGVLVRGPPPHRAAPSPRSGSPRRAAPPAAARPNASAEARAVGGVLGHGAFEHGAQLVGHAVAAQVGDGLAGDPQELGDDLLALAPLEGGPARDDREQGGGEAVDVRLPGGRAPVEHLGRAVGERSGERARRRLEAALDAGDAEVGELGLAVVGEQDVGGLDVAVQGADAVRALQRAGQPDPQPGGLLPRDRALAPHPHGERIERLERHHDVRAARCG